MTKNTQQSEETGNQGYSWHDVASEAGDWHPGLQPHVARVLGQHGIQAPDLEASQAESQGTPVQEAVATAERRRTTPEERQEAFAHGLQTLYKLTADPGLHARCQKANIDPFGDMDKPEYWRAVADYSQERVNVVRERGGDTLRVCALELIATTPSYLFEQDALNKGFRTERSEVKEALRSVGRYHSLITQFVDLYPDVRASELTMSLLNTVNTSIEDKDLRQSAAFGLRQRVRGIQHEMAFGDILRRTGRTFRRATSEEDLRGFDYVLGQEANSPVRVDVKSTLTEIQGGGAQGPVSKNEKGIFVTYSLLTDSNLRDGFSIPEELAQERAQAFLHYLNIAKQSPTPERRSA